MALKDYPGKVKEAGIRYKIRQLKYELKWAWQRAWRGYDDVDTFEIYSGFMERHKQTLREFKDSLHGYPDNLTPEKWDEILGKMIDHLDKMDEDWYDWSIEDFDKMYKEREYHKNEFFKLFSEHFYDMWD